MKITDFRFSEKYSFAFELPYAPDRVRQMLIRNHEF